jgi:hypothetical protein
MWMKYLLEQGQIVHKVGKHVVRMLHDLVYGVDAFMGILKNDRKYRYKFSYE